MKASAQMAAIYLSDNGYAWWMGIEAASAFFIAWALNRAVRKEYPWLAPNLREGGELRMRYPQVTTKTKQVFFHKIGGVVLSHASPLVVYAYASLTLVATYGNYMLMVTGVTALMNALLNGITAGIGNLVAEGDKRKIKEAFWEITILRIWLASIICFGMHMSGGSFIALWVGSEYLLPDGDFALLVAIAFINLTRTNDAFLAAYGLYKDVWAPAAEALLNLGCSILLGYFFGLAGILSGTLISLLAIVCGWKPYFLHRDGFKEGIGGYAREYGKLVALLLIAWWGSHGIAARLLGAAPGSYPQWAVRALAAAAVYMLLSMLALCTADASARNLGKRLFRLMRKAIA